MHREVVDAKEKKRLYDMAVAKGSTVNFDIGDYVLWSRVDQRLSKDKLLAQWALHGSRLRFYADSSLNVTEEIREFVSNQGMLLGVDGIADFRYNQALSRWELVVNWTGLQPIEASWEPLIGLMAQVPDKVRSYAQTVDNEDFVSAVGQS
ncbi:hypothetical protein PPTG_11531 [Phytophthora nicotianae INRA-310]|uniref:Chromo domain-containing protein n=1 Tax=Phytophthora nicotianae (strain INRA-310) TaxID=761204 RepID=W2Q7Y3_PHYN3|nr:hypothetical protein PPTG_11531 [Phytophthora nicotianae INRA-310]ETN08679.1 hypothetical protein PPTG_11531 [Phytophthora nicotianae INRA-310]